jgi:hypothetical protein
MLFRENSLPSLTAHIILSFKYEAFPSLILEIQRSLLLSFLPPCPHLSELCMTDWLADGLIHSLRARDLMRKAPVPKHIHVSPFKS